MNNACSTVCPQTWSQFLHIHLDAPQIKRNELVFSQYRTLKKASYSGHDRLGISLSMPDTSNYIQKFCIDRYHSFIHLWTLAIEWLTTWYEYLMYIVLYTCRYPGVATDFNHNNTTVGERTVTLNIIACCSITRTSTGQWNLDNVAD